MSQKPSGIMAEPFIGSFSNPLGFPKTPSLEATSKPPCPKGGRPKGSRDLEGYSIAQSLDDSHDRASINFTSNKFKSGAGALRLTPPFLVPNCLPTHPAK